MLATLLLAENAMAHTDGAFSAARACVGMTVVVTDDEPKVRVCVILNTVTERGDPTAHQMMLRLIGADGCDACDSTEWKFALAPRKTAVSVMPFDRPLAAGRYEFVLFESGVRVAACSLTVLRQFLPVRLLGVVRRSVGRVAGRLLSIDRAGTPAV